MGIIKAICLSKKRGTKKKPVESALAVTEYGLFGDAHAGNWHRQVSLLSWEKEEDFKRRGAPIDYGAFGENLLVSGYDFKNLPIGTRFKCGDVVLEMTQIGKKCHSHCEIYKAVGECIMPREGVFARVLHGGILKTGAELSIMEEKQPLDALVITMSDKGASGRRDDFSGRKACAILRQAGYRIWQYHILPDEKKCLQNVLCEAADFGIALAVTTGGTGFSVRDVTPEATLNVCERLAPGIPEAIRAYSMKITARAMLSREAAGIRKRTLIVNLPGSPKAVGECLPFILPQLQHGIEILRGEARECAREE